ncbi:MAG: flagellar protein FlaG [Thermodesulfobacteriota bacterium]
MKIGDVTQNIVHPPSTPDSLQVSGKKFENPIKSDENIAKFLKSFSEEQQKAIQDLAERINEFAKGNQFSLKFIPEKDSGMVIIKVYDAKGKLIRQIPSEELINLAEKIGKKIGFLLNVKM